jgi:hypothetical protein
VTRGIVSALRRSGAALLVQTDAAVNPGNSGGPLIDRRGIVIGITTMGYTERQGLNFAVAIDHARALLDGKAPVSFSAGAAGSETESLSPAVPSETDRARLDGARTYEGAMQRLALDANALDQAWPRFAASCGTAGGAAGEHAWLASLEARRTEGSIAPGCAEWLGDIRQHAEALDRGVLQADEMARKAGVYPGMRRDIRRRYHLDHPRWDR